MEEPGKQDRVGIVPRKQKACCFFDTYQAFHFIVPLEPKLMSDLEQVTSPGILVYAEILCAEVGVVPSGFFVSRFAI